MVSGAICSKVKTICKSPLWPIIAIDMIARIAPEAKYKLNEQFSYSNQEFSMEFKKCWSFSTRRKQLFLRVEKDQHFKGQKASPKRTFYAIKEFMPSLDIFILASLSCYTFVNIGSASTFIDGLAITLMWVLHVTNWAWLMWATIIMLLRRT